MVGNYRYVPLDLPSRDPGCIRQALALCWPMEAKNPTFPQTQDAGPAYEAFSGQSSCWVLAL